MTKVSNERRVFSISGAETTGYPHTHKMMVDSYLSSDTKINSEWIRYLSVRAKIIKLREENININLQDIIRCIIILYNNKIIKLPPSYKHTNVG